MKCLSIQQPWANLIINHGKPVENRTWATGYRGPLLIHAAKRYDRVGAFWLEGNPDFQDIAGFLYDLPGGCIIGMVNLIDCVTSHQSRWFSGPHGLVLADPVAFKRSIPYRGKLGLFDVPDEFINHVDRVRI